MVQSRVKSVAPRVGVMQLTDTLDAGGAERVAVNLANLLPREKYRSYLCATRREGPLAGLISADVGEICLSRTRRFDLGGLRRLVGFIEANNIQILHAHSTSLFVAVQASLFPPYPKVIWHDHFGEERTVWLYRQFMRKVSGVIIVNRRLADWVHKSLRVPNDSFWHVPNFVIEGEVESNTPIAFGRPGKRIVCVANLRPEKGHLTLIHAMAEVAQRDSSAHLLLVGAIGNQEHYTRVSEEIKRFDLNDRITIAGHQNNVAGILRGCDIGVLSSYSEAFPLSLVEYGKAGLATVATQVGECPSILDNGRAGVVVPSNDPVKLAEALLGLLAVPERRRVLGETLRQRVNQLYTAEPVIKQICHVYDLVLQPKAVGFKASQPI